MKLVKNFLKWSLIVFFGSMVLIFVLSDNQAPNETANNNNMEASIVFPDYRVSGPEAYGAPAIKVGNKYWLNIPAKTSSKIVDAIVDNELQARKNDKAILNGKPYPTTEITFFVYKYKEVEKVAGSDIADVIYEYTQAGGLKKNQ